jgi:hypothetical protein
VSPRRAAELDTSTTTSWSTAVDGQAGEADDQDTDAELAGFEFGIDSVAGIVAVGDEQFDDPPHQLLRRA